MNTTINQKFSFQEAKAIFNFLSNTVSMMVFFDSGSHDTRNKIGIVAHSINAIQASMFLAAIDTDCEVKIVSVSDGFEFTLALNAALGKIAEPQTIVYSSNQEVELLHEEENRNKALDLQNAESVLDKFFNK